MALALPVADQGHLDLLATGYSAWMFDRAETRIFVLDLDNMGWVVPPTGGTPVLIGSDIQRPRRHRRAAGRRAQRRRRPGA